MPSYKATTPCCVGKGCSTNTEIWFTTGQLNEGTISKIDTIQLVTTSKSTGQRKASSPSSGYTWFELVILDSPESKTPKFHEGLELAWKSHEHDVSSGEQPQNKRVVFNNTHDICGLLQPGNAIGVRVCARFSGWKNDAIEGELKIQESSQAHEQSPPKPEDDQRKASDANETLLKMFEKLYEGRKKIELSKFTLARLEEPVSWDPELKSKKFPIVREVLKATDSRIALLSLDGGGMRGISLLYILKEIMNKLAPFNGGTTPRPCEVFDLIGGTSTGGLIATMLGRLGMTVEKCIETYETLAKDVFARGPLELHRDFSLYDVEKLKHAVIAVIKSVGENEDAKMVSEEPRFGGCRCVVFACNRRDMEQEVTYFRSYRAQDEVEIQDCKIWEAARATTAAPLYFESITIGSKAYVDGGLRANNPVGQIIAEAGDVFDQPLPIGCVISLGAGRPPKLDYENLLSLPKVAIGLMTSAEAAHNNVRRLVDNYPGSFINTYHRFNAPLGKKMEGGKVDWVDEAIDLDNVGLMNQMAEGSKAYLADLKVQDNIAECVKALSTKLPPGLRDTEA